MNKVLAQYKQMIEAIDDPQKISDWITYGDWMLLTTNRKVLAGSDTLSEEELELVQELDEQFKEYLTEAQLKELVKMEPGMPVKEWWGD